MIITNKYNLPQALVDLVTESQYVPNNYSFAVTSLINGVKETLLYRRHENEIECDVSDMINTIFGTAVHGIIEEFDKTGFSEMTLKKEIRDGYYLSGKCDLYDENNFALIDYKTATVWKVKFSDFDDWKQQGLMYAWLLINEGHYVDKIIFYGLLKDWTSREKRVADMKGEYYPESQVYKWEYKIKSSDLVEIERFIRDRFDAYIKYKDVSDDEIEECSKKEAWALDDSYAVYKNKTDKRAYRVFETEKEAIDFIHYQMNDKADLVYRPGERRKCKDYCSCSKFCHRKDLSRDDLCS